MKFDNVPRPPAPKPLYEAFLKDAELSNQEGTVFRNPTGTFYLDTGLMHSLQNDEKLRTVPRHIQAILRTNRTKLVPGQCLRVSQTDEFTPLWGGRQPGSHGDVDDDTFLYIAENRTIHYGVKYYVSYLGLVVSSLHRWMTRKKAVKHLNAGTGVVIGYLAYKNKHGRIIRLWCVVNYNLLLAGLNPENYRYVNVADEDCSDTRYKVAVAAFIAGAYDGVRPSTDPVVHHMGDRFNNNKELLIWMTQQENMLKENRTPG